MSLLNGRQKDTKSPASTPPTSPLMDLLQFVKKIIRLTYFSRLDQIAIFDPAVLIVSLGTDIAKGDPIADWNVTESGFRQAAEMIAGLRLPILVIQEGGYSLLRIGRDVAAFLLGLKAE